jgi:hypothetical protein
MMKLSRLLFVILITFIIPVVTYFVMESTTVVASTSSEKVIYNLPYPGILPDHPFYLAKILRDRTTEFLTRDNLKKAHLYLLYSDKRVAMAMALTKEGKNALAIETFSKAEKYSLQIPPLVAEAKKQGVSPPSNLIDTLKLSNAKHQELLDNLMKDLPQGSSDAISAVLNLNSQVAQAIQKLP